ncbi:hypothetical protein B0J18DRAFT_448004 [Chaetomium sp. MPI-SDFR-AT-0129]|nr:hypothetical protein B0J18DRAFT_448004 [Chaetomium sp. MPI-SDFR-AT-0129]
MSPPGMKPPFILASNSPPRFTFWHPPPDPEKPACPYQAGFTVEIKRHTPPPPFGDPHYGPGPWPERNDVDLEAVTQTELVLAHPPFGHPNTVSSSSSSSSPTATTTATATLTILEPLAVDDGRGAQLVVCSVTPSPCPQKSNGHGFVAKIFDPLYYSFECPHAVSEADDTPWLADVDYSHEAAALDHLERMRNGGRTGLAAPRYYGAWTFTLPITHAGKEAQRSVRLVLMEHINGHSIRSVSLDPALLSRYTEADRLDILAMVLDGSVRQRHAGVDQRDLAARNVILRSAPISSPSGSNKQQSLPQPVIVDYNIAVVFELSRLGKRPCQFAELPQNPMCIYWGMILDFGGWIPREWQESHKLYQEWLKERFGGEAAEQYAPVEVELEFSDY